jgi:uncharacterized protein (DUF433 family)
VLPWAFLFESSRDSTGVLKILFYKEFKVADILDRITLDPGIRSGKPIINGTRITVSDILEYMAGGMSEQEILADFPDLLHEDILATLAFAAQREHRLFSVG